MNNTFSHEAISVDVPGKIILIGEHSVVYGHHALATPLTDVRLKLTTFPEQRSSWHSAWQICVRGKAIILTDYFAQLLTQSLELAMNAVGKNLTHFEPQSLFIESDIPLGGGMGGSAAVSASLVKLCAKIFNKSLSLQQEIESANQIDSLFHFGRASGLDVTTILANQCIAFQKDRPIQTIKNPSSFFIALVDSCERSETRTMVEKVSRAKETYPEQTEKILQNLGMLAFDSITHLTQGHIEAFTQNLNLAQSLLNDLGVSTPTLNQLCDELRAHGALCAKLTGAGGGGLVLGIFDKNPDFLNNIYGADRVFITKI